MAKNFVDLTISRARKLIKLLLKITYIYLILEANINLVLLTLPELFALVAQILSKKGIIH
ncbi:MAG: hypothetical protein IRD7MM_05905 [Candidatus Midichloria mitochondrii]